jgi:hypothetical protein
MQPTHKCHTIECTRLCTGRAVYCPACASERLRVQRRNSQRKHRLAHCQDGRRSNGKRVDECGIPRHPLGRPVIDWVPLPPPRDGYCTACRETRLSAANVSGICDECADDAAAFEQYKKHAETFKVQSAKAGIE